MPVIDPPLRELFRAAYEPGIQTITSTATHGAALTATWGGTFTIASRSEVDVEISIYFIANSGANDTTIHVLVDGTCRFEDTVKLGATTGRRVHGKTNITGLSAGSHTIAVQGSVSAGNGYLASGAPPVRCLLTVREVG